MILAEARRGRTSRFLKPEKKVEKLEKVNGGGLNGGKAAEKATEKVDKVSKGPFNKIQGSILTTNGGSKALKLPEMASKTERQPQIKRQPLSKKQGDQIKRAAQGFGEKPKPVPKKPAVEKKAVTPKPVQKIKINIPGFLSVTNLANILKVRTEDLLFKLKELGFDNMTYNFILDNETASLIADDYGFEVNINDDLALEIFPDPVSDPKLLKPRAPIVTIMGHVDHGKTTILDFLRKSSIVDKEFGGITQHIGAFSVMTPKSKKRITFLDTPGHAAFLKMRERGANITDIVVLVVAADDSVMPQTKEAIRHAKNAGVQIIVAINKCDKPQLNPDKVVSDLALNGIDVEDYGGEVQTVRVSGKTGLGMENLEEAIVTLAEIQDLKTEDKKVRLEGWVIESEVKKGMGNVATFLVTRGTLKTGSILVAGTTWCKVRSMKDEFGKNVKTAGPSTPVEITGWKELPEAGDNAIEALTEALAKKVVANRITRNDQIETSKNVEKLNELRLKELEIARRNEKLEELNKLGLSVLDVKDSEEYLELHQETEKELIEVSYIVKADVSGSAELIMESISGLGNDEVKSNVLFQEVGPPTESDVDRAAAAGATILCFNVKIPKEVGNEAAKTGVKLREYTVIYHLIEDVIEELTLKLPSIYDLKVRAKVSIKQAFEISVKRNKVKVAGCRVEDGVLKKNSKVRVIRDGEEIWRGEIESLKREKEEVEEIKKGGDCGVSFKDWQDFNVDDVVEVYEEEKVKRYL